MSFLRGLLEVLQLDFLPTDVSEAPESQLISFHLELPGNIKDVGVMRISTSQRDYVGLAPLVMVRELLWMLVEVPAGGGGSRKWPSFLLALVPCGSAGSGRSGRLLSGWM